MKKTIYYTTITYKPLCKNGSWRFGGHAHTVMSSDKKGLLKMEVSQFGKTQEEAEKKIIKFLNSNGENQIVCIKSFKTIAI